VSSFIPFFTLATMIAPYWGPSGGIGYPRSGVVHQLESRIAVPSSGDNNNWLFGVILGAHIVAWWGGVFLREVAGFQRLPLQRRELRGWLERVSANEWRNARRRKEEPSISGSRPFLTPVAIWDEAPQRTTELDQALCWSICRSANQESRKIGLEF
jgi:hypothetical protein